MGNHTPSSGAAPRPRAIRSSRSPAGEGARRMCHLSIAGIVYFILGFQLACFWHGYGSIGGAIGGPDLAGVERRLMGRLEALATGGSGQKVEVTGGSGGQKVEAAPGGGSSDPGADDASNEKNGTRGVCDPQRLNRSEGIITWKPMPQRYLLAMCSGGQLSNRLACFRQNMLDAAVLNRTLIIPTRGIDYNYDNLLNINATKACFANPVILTLDEYRKTLNAGEEVKIGRFICHVHTYQTEEVCEQLATRYTVSLGVRFLKREVVERRLPSPWFKYPSRDLVKKFHSGHRVLAFGNMFGVGGRERELKFHGARPLAVTGGCRGLIQPSREIQETAAGFIDAFLGTNFVGVHLRRGDFFAHCLRAPKRRHACYHPIHQVARCLAARVAARPNDSMLFLASNAERMEVAVLRDALSYQGRALPIVQLPPLAGQAWAEPLVKKGLAENAEVLSFVDKVVCANSRVFYGTWGSTFTHDIFRLREWWNSATTCDSFFCDPEEAADVIPLVEAAAEGQAAPATGAAAQNASIKYQDPDPSNQING